MLKRNWLKFLVLVLVLAIPLVAKGYVMHVFTQLALYIILASGLNIIVGLCGRTAFAHASFAVIGGYVVALTQMRLQVPFWIALPLAGAFTMLTGVLLGIPAVRTRGPYLSLVTLGFAEIVRQVSLNAMKLTRGPLGIPGVPRPTIGGFRFNQSAMFLLCASFALLSVIAFARISNSRFGRSILAIREDETAAQAFGINVWWTTVSAFALSALFAGIGGALSATYIALISPDFFTIADTFVMVCMVILGGSGTIIGPVLGAVVLGALPELLRFLAEYRMLLFGALLVVGIRWKPAGVISPALDRKLLRRLFNA